MAGAIMDKVWGLFGGVDQKMADTIIQSVVTSKKIKKDNATIVVLKIK